MNTTGIWRCLLVEDDVRNARYIAEGLRELGHVAAICGDGESALTRATEETWDVIVLDRMLPKRVDGLSILASLRGLGIKTPVLVLSALSALDERVKGLKAGGDDYLAKPFAFSELAARLEALVRRSRSGPEARILQIGDLRLNLATRQVQRGGREIALQPREFRLLAYFMSQPGQVLTRTMLLEAVWDYQFNPRTNVIDVQVSRLRSKLEVGSDRPLIRTVRNVGYCLITDEAHAEPGSRAASG